MKDYFNMEEDITKEINKIHDDLNAYKEVFFHNREFLSHFSQLELEDFKDLIYGCEVTDKIKIVDEPNGDCQNEDCGIFKNVYVDQWSVGIEGDSYEGFIYANVKSKWIKVPYSC